MASTQKSKPNMAAEVEKDHKDKMKGRTRTRSLSLHRAVRKVGMKAPSIWITPGDAAVPPQGVRMDASDSPDYGDVVRRRVAANIPKMAEGNSPGQVRQYFVDAMAEIETAVMQQGERLSLIHI